MRPFPLTQASVRTRIGARALVVSVLVLVPLWAGLTSTAAASTQRPQAAKTTAAKASVAACTPSQVSTSVMLYTLGSSPTAPVGAVLFHNISGTACSLRGVPTIGVLNASGQRIPVYQRSSTTRRVVPAVLQPSSTGSDAGSSLTWSGWSCPEGSFSLTIEFPGWSTSVPGSWGSVPGYSGTPCAVTGATLYVSTVATISK